MADKEDILIIYLTPFKLLLGNPIPFIPFPLTRGRGIVYLREASPLFDSPFLSLSFKGEREVGFEGAKPLQAILTPTQWLMEAWRLCHRRHG